jgi:3-oxoacyl-[acyl-carrier-protein] synthase II
MGKGSQFAVTAASEALEDAGIFDGITNRIGVSLGTTGGEIQILEKINQDRFDGRNVYAREFLPHPCQNIPANVARIFGLHGPNLMIPTACAAGNYAIGYACDLIRSNRAEVMLAGGADPFSKVAFTGFARLGAIAPEKCQPFDKNRKGMMVGEGAGILVLETYERARNRGVEPYAEVIGYGLSCDGYHMTTPHPEGIGAIAAMEKALQAAGIEPGEVDYINAHGTGTPANDRSEAIAIKKVFKDRKILVSSIKSMIGHTMGAASAIETIACALALKNGIVPPTVNYENPDPECDVDCVPNTPREVAIRIALNNAYAFGGNNSSLVLRKIEA